MGGERETTVRSTSIQTGGMQEQELRIHESAGEVHFHEDKQHLKASVKSAEFWKVWDGFRTGSATHWQHKDFVNGTLLEIGTAAEGDVFVRLTKSTLAGPTFQALDKFAHP